MTARHLPAFRSHDDVEIVAVYDRQLARAKELARRAGPAVQAFDILTDFLTAGVDIVSVATSPWSHRDIAVAALEQGAHVFTEKPMAMNSSEAIDMVSAAATADRLLCVSHNFLFSNSVRRVDVMLAGTPVDYACGVQLSSESRRLPSWYRGLPGGLMFDEAPHMLYSMNHYLGGALKLDHARGTFSDDGHPRTVEVLLRGATGVGQVTMVFCAPVSEWHLNISSAAVVASVDLFRDIAIRLRPDGQHGALDIAKTSASAVSGHVAGFVKSGARLISGRQRWGHDVIIGRFIDAALGRCASPVAAHEALEVVAITDQILDALGLRSSSLR
jgi:predicted dehydrogenase